MTSGPRPGLAANALWTWTSVAVNLVAAVVVSPLMIRRLGPEAYGLWVIAFGVTAYYSIGDLGVRSAVLKYVAHHWTLGETAALNRTLNTALVYFGGGGLCILLATLALSPLGPKVFIASPEMAGTFVFVLMATGAGFALTFAVSWLQAALESVQRFDVSSRIVITASLVRVIGTVVVLLLGFGLVAVVIVAVGARAFQCVLIWQAFRRHFTQWRWARADVDRATFRTLFAFSIFTLPANTGLVLIEHGPAVIIGHLLPAQFVGYFMLPRRLLQTVMDLVHGLGAVTTARSAELSARGDRDALVRLGIQANRYSLIVFLPAALFLLLYGEQVIRLWLTPEFAVHSAPVLMVFAVGYLLADASQFNSSAMLYGIAKHQLFSFLLVGEAIASVAFVYYFSTQGSLWHAAVGCSAAMFLTRGLLTPYLLCRHLRYPLARYLADVAVRPLVAGVLAGAAVWLCRSTWLPGTTVPGIVVAVLLTSTLCVLLAGRLCLFPEHYAWAVGIVRRRAPWGERPVRAWLGIPLSVEP